MEPPEILWWCRKMTLAVLAWAVSICIAAATRRRPITRIPSAARTAVMTATAQDETTRQYPPGGPPAGGGCYRGAYHRYLGNGYLRDAGDHIKGKPLASPAPPDPGAQHRTRIGRPAGRR